MIIAIDGPAASGKGTLAKKLARHYNLDIMDTGALYRAVALNLIESGLENWMENDAITAANHLSQHIKTQGAEAILSNPALRDDTVGLTASKVAAIQPVRAALLAIQRDFAREPRNTMSGAVLDGRDIGTVIWPEADFKLFVTASVEARAERRLKELQSKGIEATYSTVLADMQERDARDSHTLDRHFEPGYVTNILDTSTLGPDEVFKKALEIIEKA